MNGNQGNNISQASMYLVYSSANGELYYQPWQELQDVGGLIDPDTDEDMELIGWSLTD